MVEYNYSLMGKIGSKNRWERVHSKVIIKDKISKEKISINSYLCGDGYIKIREKGFHYEICFFLDNLFLAKRIVSLFNKEYNVNPKIREIKSKTKFGIGYYRVEIKNKPVCLNLLSLGKYDGLNWIIPNSLDKNLLREWIKCFFDCEAYVNLFNQQIQVKSVNESGLREIKKGLLLYGINSKVYGPYKNGEGHNPYFMLTIYNLKDLLLYKSKIGFYHPDKVVDLGSFKSL